MNKKLLQGTAMALALGMGVGVSGDGSEELEARLNGVRETLAQIRFIFNRDLPFLGHLVNAVPTEFAPVRTAACTNEGVLTGGCGKIYFDPNFVLGLTRGQLATVWLHEVLHLAYGWHARLGSRDPKLWNIAHDYVINLVIDDFMKANPDLGLAWPTEGAPLLDEAYRGMSGEAVYETLLREMPEAAKERAQRGGQAAQGAEASDSGAGDQAGNGQPEEEQNGGGQPGGTPSGIGPDGKPSSGRDGGDGYSDCTDCINVVNNSDQRQQEDLAERMAHRWQSIVAEAHNIQKMRGIGVMPLGAQALVDGILKPRISWIDQLNFWAEGSLKGGGRTYLRPSKRGMAAGILLPGRSRKKARMAVVDDTSGSQFDAATQRLFKGVVRQLAESADAEVRLVQWDVAMNDDRLMEDLDEFEFVPFMLRGGGGTDFRNLPAHLGEEGEPVQLAIIYTDGDAHWPPISEFKSRDIDVVVALTEKGKVPPKGYKFVRLKINA